MSATSQKTPSAWNAVLGILCLVLGASSFAVARLAARHVVRHTGYKSGYAPMYPWQEFAFGICMLIIGTLLLYPTIRRLARGSDRHRGHTRDARSSANTSNET
jgi:hypothetical protein